MRQARGWTWGIAGAGALLLSSVAMAQTVITQWNFNAANTNPSTGAGTLTLIGSAQAANSGAFATQTGNGPGSTDPNPGQAYNTSNYPAQGTASGTAGLEFAVSTVNYTGISVLFDARASAGASRYMKVQYSTNGGGSWVDAPGGVFQNNNTNWTQANTTDLSGDAACNQNANFRFRIVTFFSPAAFTANSIPHAADTAYQPSGTLATNDYISGQTDSPNFGGTIRWDMITVRGTSTQPTPPVIGVTGASPPAVCPGGTTLLTVPVTPGTTPPSTGIVVTVNLTQVGGSASQQMFDDQTNGDLVAGDGIYSYSVATAGNSATGNLSLPVSVIDGQNRTANGAVALGVGNCTGNSNSTVVISQIYGGGGNTGAPLNADYVELFNRSGGNVDVTGWSVQYSSATGITGFVDASSVVTLSGVMAPGTYRLVQMSAAGVNGVALPTPDFAAGATFSGMAGGAGRVALASSATLIGTAYTDPSVKDLVGYGSSAISYEGAGPTGTLANDTAAFRKGPAGQYYGCQDSNQNFNDFDIGPPAPRNSATAANSCPSTGPDCFRRGNPVAFGACSPHYGSNGYARPNANGNPVAGGADGGNDNTQCMGDWDGDGCVVPSDVAAYIGAFFYSANHPGDLGGDVDCDGTVVPSDVAAFINHFFNALTGPAGEGCV